MDEREKCISFLERNGYVQCLTDGNSVTLEHTSSSVSDIDIVYDEIVFVGDGGDWLHIPVNYYALIGAMIHFSQIGVGYKHAEKPDKHT